MTRSRYSAPRFLAWIRSFLFFTAMVATVAACSGSSGGEPVGVVDVEVITPDFAFNVQKAGFNGRVFSVAPALDGTQDIYVGGDFATCNGIETNRIARLNADSSLDAGFDVGTGFNGRVRAISPAIDGSGDVYIGGDFTTYAGVTAPHIIRLNVDGSVDASFVVGAGFSFSVNAIVHATNASGDIFVGGNFGVYNGAASRNFIRLQASGAIRATVGPVGFDGVVETITVAGDGSGDVYIGGSFSSFQGFGSNRIARLNSNLTRDSTFTIEGGFNGTVRAIAMTMDGSGALYVGGDFTQYQFVPAVFEEEFNRIARVNSDGSIDSAFAMGIGSAFNDSVGALKTTFDGSGDIYVGGAFTTFDGAESNRLVRLNSNGTLDSEFVAGTGCNSSVDAFAFTEDLTGELFLGGAFNAYNGYGANRIARLKPDGSVNDEFTIGAGFDNFVFGSAVATDDSLDVYLCGRFSSYNGAESKGLIRFKPDGSVDESLVVGIGFNGDVLSVAPALDGTGDLFVGGSFTSYDGVNSGRIVRLNADGSVEDSFVTGSGFDASVLSILSAADGSGAVYIGGEFTSYDGMSVNRILRLDASGAIETDFDSGVGFDNVVRVILPVPDDSGDLFVGGAFSEYNGQANANIIRLNDDGTVDTSIGSSGFSQGGVFAMATALDESGDLYVGGPSPSFGATPSNRIIRLNSDLSFDSDFVVGQGFNNSVRALAPAVDGSGDVYVGGDFTLYDGAESPRLIRLNEDGSLDPDFEIVSGFNNSVRSILQVDDSFGEVYVGGVFTTFEGAQVDFITVLNPDGSLD